MAESKTFKPKGTKKPFADISIQLSGAKAQLDEAANQMDNWPIGSAQYETAKKKHEQLRSTVQDLQAQADTQKTESQTNEQATKSSKAQKELADAEQRARDKGIEPTTDPKVQAAKANADAVKPKVTTPTVATPTATTPPVATPPAATPPASTPPSSTPATTDNTTGKKYTNVKGILNYDGQPFTGQYNDKYYSAGKVETPEQIKADFIQKFGVQAALVASDPELSALFTQAVSAPSQGGGWSADKWKTEFENTQWYKSRTSAARNSEIQRVSSPVDYSQAYNNARQKAQQFAAAEGVQLTDAQLGAAIPDANLSKTKDRDVTGQDLAQWILDNNPTDVQLRAHLIQVGQVNATALGGAIQSNAQQLKQYANDLGLNNMLLPPSSKDGLDWFAQSARQIESGTTSLDTQKQYLINMAKRNFPAYDAQLDAGVTTRQLAAPYINSLSNLLELGTDQIDMSSSTGYGALISKALRGNNDPKNPVPMDLSTFENQVRSMPQWLNTKNAKSSILDSGVQLLQTFGLVR